MNIANWKNSTMFRTGFIGFLILVLLIPLGMVSSSIYERENRRNEAVSEVSAKWGYAQDICGPVLTVPYRQYYRDKNNITRVRIRNAYFLPDSLSIKGEIIPETRSRGLYEVILYNLKDLEFKGYFSNPDFSKLRIPKGNVLWDDAFITAGIPDTRGIQKSISLRWGKGKSSFYPGVRNSSVYSSGIHAYVKNLKDSKMKQIPFSFTIDLKGSSSLSFAPAGKETNVHLSSAWEHPSFYGSYLPSRRSVSEKGFNADWKVSYFGRNFPQAWTDSSPPSKASLKQSSFGVKLYQPVDFYQKSVRAVKYGVLFLSLTFLTFFLFEVFSSLSIHPLQYLMIGFGMILFYMLFVSLSEHLNFIISYFLSAIAVISMITGYSIAILKTRRRGGIIAGLLLCLYAYLFILLENQDYTLLLGSVALFMILGVVMYITRNVDWYRLKLNEEQ